MITDYVIAQLPKISKTKLADAYFDNQEVISYLNKGYKLYGNMQADACIAYQAMILEEGNDVQHQS